MKKDIFFIKEILNTLEVNTEPYLSHSNILEKIQLRFQLSDKELLKKYYYHISLLYDLNCLENITGRSKSEFDFIDDEINYLDVYIRLTNNGHSMLVALNNDDIWNKLLSFSNKITNEVLIEAGKKVTSLGLESLFT